MKKGDIIKYHSTGGNQGVLLEAWKDKKIVRMISTGMIANAETVQSRSGSKVKPATVIAYNKNARGIDLSDMHIHFYDINRKSHKW